MTSSSARRLTGIAGRWSAAHPWIAIAAWVGCVVVLLVTGRLVGTVQLPNSQTGSGQTGQAEQMMSRDFAERANLPRWLRWLPRTSPSEPQPTRQPPKQPVTAG